MSRSPDGANGLGDRREGQRLSHGLVAHRACVQRNGATLLELIVVLALLGLILTIAAPSFTLPPIRSEDPRMAALVAARRQAVIRGEPVTVSINGTRVHVSPLGTCIPETTSHTTATWDAIGCAAFQAVGFKWVGVFFWGGKKKWPL
jgi:prepilin-type N-terminal cleavage/methylation domain-containing protein